MKSKEQIFEDVCKKLRVIYKTEKFNELDFLEDLVGMYEWVLSIPETKEIYEMAKAKLDNGNSRNHYNILLQPQEYRNFELNKKDFLLIKNDNNYKIYDMITFEEDIFNDENCLHRQLSPKEIIYIISDSEGLKKDYCILQLK